MEIFISANSKNSHLGKFQKFSIWKIPRIHLEKSKNLKFEKKIRFAM